MLSCVLSIVVLTALGAVVAQAPPPAAERADHGDARIQVENTAPPRIAVMSEQFMPGEYWLGVQCIPAAPALRAQLNLPKRQGLLVVEVLPKSPAAKAGIVRHDILLRIGKRQLGNPRNLVEAVEAANETEEKIELIRGGNRQNIVVTLAKRPEEARRKVNMFMPAQTEDDWKIIHGWIEGMRQGQGGTAGQPPVHFRFFHPGAIVSQSGFVQKPMPENMSVIVSKNGDQPMRIEIRRNDDKWVLTDKSLDKLPDDVRPFVERMVGGGMKWTGGMHSFDVVPNVMVQPIHGAQGKTVFSPRPQPGQKHVVTLPGLDPRLEQRFNEMNRRMDRMLKMMEKMMENRQVQPPENDD